MKKFFVVFLCIAMVVVCMPTFAFAAENDVQQVSDMAGLKAALEAGGNVELTANITSEARVDISITKPVTLDLKGFSASSTYGGINHFLMTVRDGGSLTLNDSVGGGKLAATHSSYGYGIQLYSGSTFIMNGGAVETTQETVDVCTSASNVKIEINDGALVSSDDSVLNARGKESVDVQIKGGTLSANGMATEWQGRPYMRQATRKTLSKWTSPAARSV